MTIAGLAKQTIAYWKGIRVAWLTGYKIGWVIPGRDGSIGSTVSVWSLDVRVQPVETIIPARTARYGLESFVLVGGRPHIEPPQGTRVRVDFTLAQPHTARLGVSATEAPTGLGETARWLPVPGTYVGGVWSPSSAPVAPDAAVSWQAAEENAPVITDDFEYSKHGQWVKTTAMLLRETNYMRLDGMPLYTAGVPNEAVTLFFVAAITAPVKYWGSLLRAVEPDGSTAEIQTVKRSNLDLRLMPDGNLHPFTWGWQEALPLLGENHALSLFGFTLDPLTNSLRLFTIDRELRIADMAMPYPHSQTSSFVLGRSAEASYEAYVLDIMLYRGPMDKERLAEIANEFDSAYGISSGLSQEQG